jgi:hypothetical protein
MGDGGDMRITRALFGTAVAVAALAALAGCAELSQSAESQSAADAAAHGSAPPANRNSVFVQVSPSTVAPGSTVQIRASCVDNTASATVTSQAFGQTTVLPSNSMLFAEVTIPATATSGRFDVTVTCKSGSTATTSLTIMVSGATTAPVTRGPNTGGGYLARHGGADASTPWTDQLSGPAGWFGIGVLALLAAAAIGLRSRRMRRAPAPARPRQPVPVEPQERETTR